MNKIWNQRLGQYQQKLLKYLRYVFNDHFVIALFFVFGAVCYGYFNFIDHYVHPLTFFDRLVAIVALMIILQIGKLVTLLQKPDIVFLLPNDYRINDYLIKARHHSMIMTALIQISCGLITVPFLVRILHFKWFDWVILIVSQVLLKWMQLLFEENVLFDQKWNSGQMQLLKQGISLIGIAIGILVSPWMTLIIAVVSWGGMLQLRKKANYHVFKWKDAIAAEDKRVMRIYKFFSLFTDVPEVHQKIKRRRYLDRLLPRFQQDSRQTYKYLYWRGFWRNSEYSGLFMRLTIIGVLLMLFINLKWVSLLIGLLFVYLTSFQLIPLANQFYDIVFTHLYPVKPSQQLASFRKVLGVLTAAQVVIFTVALLIATHSLVVAVILVIGAVGIELLLVYFSLNKRFNKGA
ncbi:ABC transporter permease [Ligilactobacillus araffinosus]|uniref:Protein ecsb n=1 Tax=Ligilactobacillus araffinosus DSM 20653 TaxID=1423820 RepID=A0A0R1ZF19_9LACO|nr:ABC transporter permease [Ligilactobacillus araffinosus]KRM53345.1 protein ecsb [Ligilactobacillus araffinosus DSM 20653]